MNKKLLIFIFLSLFLLFSKEVRIKVIDKDLNIPLEGVKIILLKSINFPMPTSIGVKISF